MGWTKVLTIYCDTDICNEELQLEGRQATKEKVVAYARGQGWKVGADGRATCQECNYTGQDFR